MHTHGSHTRQNMPCKTRTLCASLSLSLCADCPAQGPAQVAQRKSLCASFSVHVALRKLLRACCSAQVAPCKFLCVRSFRYVCTERLRCSSSSCGGEIARTETLRFCLQSLPADKGESLSHEATAKESQVLCFCKSTHIDLANPRRGLQSRAVSTVPP